VPCGRSDLLYAWRRPDQTDGRMTDGWSGIVAKTKEYATDFRICRIKKKPIAEMK
jgi:hypothetical protein